jgi:hypothetical protein
MIDYAPLPDWIFQEPNPFRYMVSTMAEAVREIARINGMRIQNIKAGIIFIRSRRKSTVDMENKDDFDEDFKQEMV